MRIISISLFLLILLSCNIEPNTWHFSHNESFINPTEINQWVNKNVNYSYSTDDFQMPEKTYNIRAGDCEDLAILVMYFADEIGYKSEMLIVNYKSIDNDKLHAVVRIDGLIYDPTIGLSAVKESALIDINIIDVYSYNKVMSMSLEYAR